MERSRVFPVTTLSCWQIRKIEEMRVAVNKVRFLEQMTPRISQMLACLIIAAAAVLQDHPEIKPSMSLSTTGCSLRMRRRVLHGH